MTSPILDIDALIDDPQTRIVVCCGAGGVGKTTVAAALGLRAAESGRKVVVLTIDPARRLAQSLGLSMLGNTPRPIEGIDDTRGGSLDAMMLDMKRTFDEVVMAHAAPDKAEQILANPFYQAVSSSFAGTQEYMAMEKLGQLRLEADRDPDNPRWDLIIVDTPPSRSALDFLDAPKRLGSFLDGRFIRLLAAPARVGGRASLKIFSVGVSIVTSTMTKVLGGQMLLDVQTFVAALDTMFGGFRERADHTYALLSDSTTKFIVVAVPERDALREASYFVDRLEEEGMPLAGLVVNRMYRVSAPGLSAARALSAADELEGEGIDAETDGGTESGTDGGTESRTDGGSDPGNGSTSESRTDRGTDAQTSGGTDPGNGSKSESRTNSGKDRGTGVPASTAITAALLRLHAVQAEVAGRHQSLAKRFTASHPDIATVEVPAASQDIHDLVGLRAVGEALAGT